MTKLLHLLLATLLAFSLFGCSKGNPPETVPPETTAPVVTTEAATTEATTEATTQPTAATKPVETTAATEPVETTVPTEEPTEPQGIPGTVTARSLNVRSAPGVSSPLVTTLSYGTSVTVYEKTRKDDMDWGRIDQGWVSLDYVRLESGSASVPTAQTNQPNKPNSPTQPTTQPTKPTTSEHKHAYSESVTKPTCTAQGYTTYTCSCGASYTGNQKAALGHSWSAWITVTQPTQTAYGKAERKCTRCNATESKTLDKLAQTSHKHTYNTGTVTTAPGCETSGVKTFSCSCGASYTETIPATGHKYNSGTVTVKPSCAANGVKTYSCPCGASYTEAIPATGHKYNSGTVTTNPGCEAPGVKTFSCFCGASYTETIPATGHAYTSQVVPASCGVSGYTKHTCSNCGKTYTDNQTAALDHSYSAWTTTTPPTETSTGVSTRTCSHCGRTETKTIPKLEPAPTQPTQPKPTEPPVTEPPVTEPPATEHVHEWVHHHQDEVGHKVLYSTCHCGWSCPYEDDAAWIAHQYSFADDPEEFNKHSYYTTSVWVVDQPAKDWDECACGATK